MTDLCLDNSIQSHFARADRLPMLRDMLSAHHCISPSEVATEILAGVAEYPALGKVVIQEWIDVVELTDILEVVRFAAYKAEFGGGPDRNNGEAAVLALVSVRGGLGVVDDRVARRAARRDGVPVTGTMGVVCDGVREGRISRADAEKLIDELIATDMRLPASGPEFMNWALENGLIQS